MTQTGPEENEEIIATTQVVAEVFDSLYYFGNDLIYHYCSAESLLSILTNKTLRFGDATCMNDGDEILWADKQIRKAISRLRDRDDVPDHFPAISKIFVSQFLSEWEECMAGSRQFLSCFSISGDSLSQWRAYADDARGFSIGFDSECLDLPAQFTSVNYNEHEQQEYLMKAVCQMYKCFRDDEAYFEDQGLTDLTHLYGKSAAFKNPAFADEREIRANHLAVVWPYEDRLPEIKFSGGSVKGKKVDTAEIKYRSSNGKLVPYIDFPFELYSDCAIREIWIGPRCAMSQEDVNLMLGTLGYTNIIVKKAGSNYR